MKIFSYEKSRRRRRKTELAYFYERIGRLVVDVFIFIPTKNDIGIEKMYILNTSIPMHVTM